MEKLIDISTKTQGRDKLYRTLQYVCKLAGWAYKEMDWNAETIKKLSALESHSSTARKYFRLGKSLESLRSARATIHLLDPSLKYSLTLAHLNRAIFLLVDHYLWLGRVGITKVDKKWDYISARFYLASIILTILRDFYPIYLTYLRQTRQKNQRDNSMLIAVYTGFVHNPEATLDLVKNFCDLPIPGSKLGYFPNHNGLVGLLGLISSLIGLYQVAYPHLKLRP